MRKLSFLLLLATASAPALAAIDSDRSDRQRGHSAEQSEERAQRAKSRRSGSGQRQVGAPRSERSQASQRGSTERVREQVQQRQLQREQRQQVVSAGSGATEPAHNWRERDRSGERAQTGSTLRPRERQVRTIPNTQPNTTVQHSDRRGFEGQRRDYRDGNYNRWTRNWHRDSRYDWRRYRDGNRSIFRLGFYYDPFGSNYRSWSIGSFLYPSYYGSSYWLNDPWQYRLPPAYGPYRWVRYWNDALLVNIYTGEVVDVIHSFFW